MVVKIEWKVSQEQDHILLREFLRKHKGLSKKALADIKYKGGQIRVNKQEKTVRTLIHKGDIVEIHLPKEVKSETLLAQIIPLEIVFEDQHLLVINKPAGMPTIPSCLHPSNTLANAVVGYYEKHEIPATFHAVNRLDRETSGLLVIAKHGFSHDQLAKAQKVGNLKRFYKALVEGAVTPVRGTIDDPIGRKPTSIIERMVTREGKPAITHYEVTRSNSSFSVVDIELETGRTHQIRVHFSHLGHPLVGDELYGGTKKLLHRHALHCERLELTHPFTGETHTFNAALPKDLEKAKEAMGL
ncbi:RluA family pseudouridine synthase [Bacillus sp. FJAT-45037]|uniref:RluA family pseudouridine synthase n=1 Tax=Bacillus sp. FJAT-45037 TaxID=2011007 RepID=UPI000C238EC2|nr:RluA family pseudouridine synthase [Bacillus sp. FJAT-45037]